MPSKAITFGIAVASVLLVAGCGGGGGGGGGTADPGPYDLERAIFGDVGVSRTFELSGSDNDGDQWEADITRLTPSAKPGDTPCLEDEVHLDTSVTLTLTVGSSSATSITDSDNCWTVGNFLLFQFARSLTDGIDVSYEVGVTGAGIPAQASIGEGGTFGSSAHYEEDGTTPGLQTGEDIADGSSTQSWKLVDNNGKAQLVVTTTKRDPGGTLEFTEKVTVTITLDGTVTRYQDRVEFGPASCCNGLIINLST